MNNDDFSSIDNVPLSRSDSELIGKLTESKDDPVDRAALQAALSMLLKQRNMFAYKASEMLDTATSVQSELLLKATTLQTQLDHANASVELQYSVSLANDDMREQLHSAGSTLK